MTGILCMVGGAGGSSPLLDTQTVTYGSRSVGTNPVTSYGGYYPAQTIGSISDGSSNVYAGATINGLYFFEEGYSSPPVGFVNRGLVWIVNGSQANSGWTTMTVGTTAFNRVDATYSAGASTSWSWSIAIPNPFVSQNNPFSSPTTTVQWT